MGINEKIREYRKQNGLTQKEFGSMIGRSSATVRKYESGELVPPPWLTELIEKVIGITPNRMVVADIDAIQLLMYFEKLNEIARDRVVEYAEILSTVEKFKKQL